MPTIYFQLERNKTLKDGTHPIFLVLKLKNSEGKEARLRHYTGHSCLEKHWIGKGKNKRVTSKAPGAGITNTRMELLRTGVESIIANARNLKIPLTVEYFKKRFDDEVLGKQAAAPAEIKQITFFDTLDNFIQEKQNVFQPATIATYKSLKGSLLDFQKTIGYKVEFDTINRIFNSLYTKYLIEGTNERPGVLDNTQAKRIATLKAFLREMKRQKRNNHSDFEDFQAKRDNETTLMYLTESEVQQLRELKVKPGSTNEHVKDGFLFSVYTGIRFSDWANLKPENLVLVTDENGKKIQAIKFTMIKVHKIVTVPLNKYALEITEKYKAYHSKGMLFPVYTNQESNRTLKNLAKEAKIDDTIQEVKKSGANRLTYKNAKHEILTCHDGRNTFATLYLERGGRPEVLQKLMGHSQIKQTMRYVKIVEKTVISDFQKTMSPKAKILKFKKPA